MKLNQYHAVKKFAFSYGQLVKHTSDLAQTLKLMHILFRMLYKEVHFSTLSLEIYLNLNLRFNFS